VINGRPRKPDWRWGDVVKHVDNRLLTSAVQMARYISSRRVGDTITLDVQRGDSTSCLPWFLPISPNANPSRPAPNRPDRRYTISSAASRRELIRSRLKQMEKEIDILRQLLEYRFSCCGAPLELACCPPHLLRIPVFY
jgi:hypothetical protein